MTQEKRLVLDWTKVHDVFPIEKHLASEANNLIAAKKALVSGKGKSPEFTGWVDYVKEESQSVLGSIKKHIDTICNHSDAVVVVGIGGSLLGTKAVYEALTHSFAIVNQETLHRRPLLFWAGHHIAIDELSELLDALDSYSPSLIVVSKSGGTTEPALAFRVLKQYIDDRFGSEEASHRIFAITDPNDGTLLKIAKENNYPHFPIPKNIGGRYSIFTPVGLLPLAIAGVNVTEFVAGAQQAFADSTSEKNHSLETNPALCYAGVRNILYANKYKIESFCTWTPKAKGIAEWWKQLFGESDGKENTGIFPASANFTTDLHSLGQYFQEGERHLFATHLKIGDEYSLTKGSLKRKIKIPDPSLKDGFDFLTGIDLSNVQNEAQQGTFLAHSDGKVPTLIWELPELNAWWLGYWMYINMFACGVGGYARGINPFDQPGVEDYKNNMFALMGKPGYSDKAAHIRSRLSSSSRLRSLGHTSK
ncbi:glucose-6-phosphate isomerase [Fluviispira multicolorata]|uniref:Glucose-6-phosphate isomerase n=1 Tax=Fluviispira multicolorata TaxID=2654512 RepID=A0A833JGJ1_9BACT|nr:glucose-6-phosphate isomerase [Fluviispira multicolorata]KAB8032202.1 glucose-6-phosphate isomerase [Fluviispira multicolorata]